MNDKDYNAILEKVGVFQYTSLKYVDYTDLAGFSILINTEDIIIIRGFNPVQGIDEIYWAANELETFKHYMKHFPNTLVRFIPREWHASLIALGYEEYGVFRDYWIHNLKEIPMREQVLTYASLSDSLVVSLLTQENKEISREFQGEDEAAIIQWIKGTHPSLVSNKATHPNIILYKEQDTILGVVLVAIYGHDSPKGSILWVRELAVKKEHHAKGIGRTLMEAALTYGKLHHASRSFLMADDLNQHAITLYLSLGYEPKREEEQIDLISH